MTHVAETIAAARTAQADWERLPVRSRRSPIGRLRRTLSESPKEWASSLNPPQHRTIAESLAAEVLPLADACQWLERRAPRTLRRRVERVWLGSVSLRVERKPHGVVLVIGASNYPLFLLAVPAIQAMIAGNAVLLKPPPGGEAVARRLRDTLVVGGDARLCTVLDSTAEAAQDAIDAGVDHVVLTGSAATGRAVARRAAESLTPCTLECSGSDAVVILPGASIDRAAVCIAWGLRFNSGATCIAPRRVIAHRNQFGKLGARLAELFADAEPRRVAPPAADATRRLVGDAIDAGVEVVSPQGFGRSELETACDAGELPPIVLNPGSARPALLDADLFAPVVTLIAADTVEEQVAAANNCRFALGASVFGAANEATEAARRLQAGCVTVNDLIAPTGDARVPFGGAGESGYGVTRGAEGLLAMTRPQAIVRRHGSWFPHLDQPTPALDDLLAGMIQSQHAAGFSAKWRGLRRMISAASRHKQHTRNG